MKLKDFYVYILTNKTNTVLYIGMTINLVKSVYEHKNHVVKVFTDKYNTDKLVYFEVLSSAEDAIIREKQIKNWHRDWKLNKIKKTNPQFKDIYKEILK